MTALQKAVFKCQKETIIISSQRAVSLRLLTRHRDPEFTLNCAHRAMTVTHV